MILKVNATPSDGWVLTIGYDSTKKQVFETLNRAMVGCGERLSFHVVWEAIASSEIFNRCAPLLELA